MHKLIEVRMRVILEQFGWAEWMEVNDGSAEKIRFRENWSKIIKR